MKLSKEELQKIQQSLQVSLIHYKKVQQMDVDQETKSHFAESQKSLQELYDKIANEIVRLCEKTKLKNLK